MRNFRSATVSACLMVLGSLSVQAQVTGSGTKNYVPIWTSGTAIGNSKLFQTGGNVGVGTTSPAHPLDVSGAINTSASFNIGGPAVLSVPAGGENLAVGLYSLSANTTGGFNLAAGFDALLSNTTGSDNTAVGAQAMQHNTTGTLNTAVGVDALSANVGGGSNVAVGEGALLDNTGSFNTAIGTSSMTFNQSGANNTAAGYDVLQGNVTGSFNTAFGTAALRATTASQNTAVGFDALSAATTGNGNVALGYAAGTTVTTGSNNIEIGHPGASADTGVIRIGETPNQTKFFAAGIRGVTTGSNNAIAVVIDSNGQLGTVSSSIRFKEDVHDMADASSRLLQLRPVTYRYKQPYADGSQPIDYGLIAEEVAQVYPDLVATGADGQPETVQYQKLTPMLLNELKKQADTIRTLERRLAALEAK